MSIGVEPGGCGGLEPPWIRRWPIDAIQIIGLSPPRTPKLPKDFEKFGAPASEGKKYERQMNSQVVCKML